MEKNMAKIAAECLDEHKAEDILTLDVSRLTPFADHYVIATCSNERALAASADQVAEKWEKEGFEVRSIQGKPESGWMIVDGGDVVVHLFVAWQRKEVKLDELISNRNAEIHAREA